MHDCVWYGFHRITQRWCTGLWTSLYNDLMAFIFNFAKTGLYAWDCLPQGLANIFMFSQMFTRVTRVYMDEVEGWKKSAHSGCETILFYLD